MLSNACLLAKFRFDTAENGPAKILQKTLLLLTCILWRPRPGAPLEDERAGVVGHHADEERERGPRADPRGPRGVRD